MRHRERGRQQVTSPDGYEPHTQDIRERLLEARHVVEMLEVEERQVLLYEKNLLIGLR